MARGLKFRIWIEEGLYYPCSEDKDADLLCGYREADLRLCFPYAKSRFSHDEAHMSCIMRKTVFCICKNTDADQLHGNQTADQFLCFPYMDSPISLLPKSNISSL